MDKTTSDSDLATFDKIFDSVVNTKTTSEENISTDPMADAFTSVDNTEQVDIDPMANAFSEKPSTNTTNKPQKQSQEQAVSKSEYISSKANLLGVKPKDFKTGSDEFKRVINENQTTPSILEGMKQAMASGGKSVDKVMNFGGKDLHEFFSGAIAFNKVQSDIDNKYDLQRAILEKSNKPGTLLDLEVLEQQRAKEKDEAMELSDKDAKRYYGDLGKIAVQVGTSVLGNAAGMLTKNMPLAARMLSRTGLGTLQGGTEAFGYGYFNALAEGMSNEEAIEAGKKDGVWGAIINGLLNIGGGSFKPTGKEDILKVVKGKPAVKDAVNLVKEQRYKAPGFFKKLFKGIKDIVPTKQNITDTKAIMEEIPDLDPNNLQKFVASTRKKSNEIYNMLAPKLKSMKITEMNFGRFADGVEEMTTPIIENKKMMGSVQYKAWEKAQEILNNADNVNDIWRAKTKWSDQLSDKIKKGGDTLSDREQDIRKLWQDWTKSANKLIADMSEGTDANFTRQMERFSLINRVEEGALTFAKDFSKIKGMIPENLRQAAITAILFKLLGDQGKRLGRAS